MDEVQQVKAIWKYLHDGDYLSLRVGARDVGCQEKPPAIIFGAFALQWKGARLSVLDRARRVVTDEKTVNRLLGYVRDTHRRLFGAERPDWSTTKVRTDRTALLRLVDKLSEHLPDAKRARLSARIDLSVDHPATYARRYARSVKARDLEPGIANLHVFALLDAAEAAGLIRELDWREIAAELHRTVVTMGRRLSVDLSEVDFEPLDDDADSALASAAKRLETTPVRLLLLDTRSDSYPVLLVPARSAPQLLKLASKARVPLKRLPLR